MMKKFFAALTALACALPAMPVFPASALSWEEPTDYMVTEMQISEESGFMTITLREIGTSIMWTLSDCGADIAAMLEGQEMPEYGDIITLSAPKEVAEVFPGCLHYSEENPAVLVNHGNITEIGTPEYLTATGWEEYEGQIVQCHLEDENNELHLYYPDHRFGIPAPDLSDSQTGLYYMYHDQVILPADESEVAPEKIPWTATGIIIGPNLIDLNGPVFFDETVDSSGDALGAGDVVELKLRGSVAITYPSYLPAIEHIDRIGTAAEVYGYGEYTVTENDGMNLLLTDEAGEEAQYSYHLQAEMGYELYNSALVVNAQAGDVITFMESENGNPVVPADPEDLETRTEFVVIGVDDPDDPQSCIIIESSSPTAVYQLDAHELGSYLANGGQPLSYGDIFTIAGEYASTCIWGTNDIMLAKPESIRIEGSVFDTAETSEFTLTAGVYSEGSFVWLKGAEKKYQYPVDFVLGKGLMSDSLHVQPDGIDWTKPDAGDKIIMYTYNGVPMFPKAMERIGDVDGNGDVNASDSAELLISSAMHGAGLEQEVTFSADVNADGIVDAQDAAGVLVYAAAKGSGAQMSWTDIVG